MDSAKPLRRETFDLDESLRRSQSNNQKRTIRDPTLMSSHAYLYHIFFHDSPTISLGLLSISPIIEVLLCMHCPLFVCFSPQKLE